MVQVQQQGQCQHAEQTGHNSGQHTGHNGYQIFAQQIPFFIQRHCQADRCGQQQVADGRSAGSVCIIGDVQHAEHHDDKRRAQQQRVENCLTGALVDEHPQAERSQREQHAPRRRPGQEIIQPELV